MPILAELKYDEILLSSEPGLCLHIAVFTKDYTAHDDDDDDGWYLNKVQFS